MFYLNGIEQESPYFSCGECQIRGKSKRTDWLVKNILAKKGWFSPPFQTEKELRDILQKLYKETDIHVDGSMVYFRCVK